MAVIFPSQECIIRRTSSDPAQQSYLKKKKKFAATFLKRTDGQDSGHDASLALVVHV